MEQPQITFRIDFSELKGTLEALAAGQLPHTAEAVRDATLLAQRQWLAAASGTEVTFRGRSFAIRRVSGAYARSITDGLEYPADGSNLLGRVSANTAYARAIEDGSPPHDMKPALLGGDRARRGKEGQVYTIIPFRHNTPGAGATDQAMPPEVYSRVKRFAISTVTGSYIGKNARGQDVRRATYAWGSRLKLPDEFGWRSRPFPVGREYEHSTSIYSGMVKMGKPGQASYLTFRVVSERSPANSWWHPGTEPKPVSEAVAEQVGPLAMQIIRRGFEMDLAALEG